MTTIAIYLRVSTDKQDAEMQRGVVRSTIERDGARMEDCTEYCDEGYSGRLASRPDWDRLNAAIEQGQHSAVYLYSLTRVGRVAADIFAWVKKMQDLNVKVVFSKEAYDMTTPVGKLVFGIMAVFAELELDTITQRNRDTVKARRAQGLPHGVNAKPPRPGHKGYRRFTDHEEAQIMARLEGGEPRQSVADSLGVHYRTIIKVIKRARKKVAAPAG